MSYGFKFKNNAAELIIDDNNVKPWAFNGSYVGLNYETVENTTDFTTITGPDSLFRNNGAVDTWKVYEIRYVAPSNANCFVAFKLPETTSQNIWYAPQVGGPVTRPGVNIRYIPQAQNSYPTISIYALVPVSWLSSASEQQILAALPIPYFFAADPVYAPGSGYGIQVFKQDSTCMYDSNKRHIRLNSYSYGFVEYPNYAGSFGPYLPGTSGESKKAYTISGSTGSNLAFVLPESKSKVFSKGTIYGGAGPTDYSYMVETRVWYQKGGNTLYTLNPDTLRYNVSPSAYGYSNLVNNARYNMATEVTGVLDAANLSDAATRRLYGRALILDVTGFDIPYTPTEFPAGYTLSANFDAGDAYEWWSVQDKFYTSITLTTFNVPDGTQVPFTISGTGITADDFQYAYDIYRPGQTIPNPLSGYFTIQANSGRVDLNFKDDSVIEGNETMTLSLNNGKGSISVVIKERQSYVQEWISQPDSNNAFNEGDTVQFRLTTKNVSLSNFPQSWALVANLNNDFNANDLANYSLTGTFVNITQTGSTITATGSFTLRNDMVTEGLENFAISLPSVTQTIVILTAGVNDTSAPASYSLRYGTQLQGNIQANEGDTLTFTIVSNNVPNGTRVYPAFANSTFAVADFIVPNSWYDPAVGLTGVVINNNTATFSFTIKNDFLTEGVESGLLRILSTPDNTRTDNILYEWFNGRIYIYDTSVSAVYNIYSSVTSVNEGQSFQLDTSVDRNTGQTVYWRITGVDISDISAIYKGYISYDYDNNPFMDWAVQPLSLTGSFVYDSSLSQSFLITMRNDQTLEGTETLGFTLRGDSVDGTELASKSITINDTSKPTYNMYNSTSYDPDNPNYVTEGGSITWYINTSGVPNGTYLYWTNMGTTSGADFNDVYGNINYGSVLIMNNAGWFTRTLKNDLLTEGTETIVMQLRTGGNYSDGVLVFTDNTVTVADTSQAPSASIYPTSSSVNEGGTIYFIVDTPNIPDGQPIYWTNIGSAEAADFTDNSNTGTAYFSDNQATITRVVLNDNSTEGAQSIQIRIYSDAARTNILATSTSVTINDTSRTLANEIVTVTPSSVVYPNGITFSITGGTPNGYYYYSVNNTDYDNVLQLDGNGYTSSPTGGAAQNFAEGYYTIYVWFPDTNHYRQASWTVTAANPAAGTLLSTFCSGTTKYGNYANGSGGSYNQVIQANSTDCGYVPPSGPTLSNFITDTNDSGNIDLWGSPSAAYDGMRCKGAGRNSIDMYVSRTFTLNQAATITGYLHVSSEANYDFGELYFDGVLFARGSGEYESGAISGPISAGTHTIKCRYTKDGSVSGGTDTAFVEYSIS